MLKCTGCGSTETIEEIRRQHPQALSCCPERNMQPSGLSLHDRSFLLFRAWADQLPDEPAARQYWNDELSMADRGEWARRVMTYEMLLTQHS